MSAAAAKPEPTGLRNTLTIATIAGALLLMLAIWPLSMTPMIFDSGQSAATWSVFLAIWAMPVVLIAGLVTGWVGIARDAHGVVVAGLILAALPVLAGAGVLVMSGI